MRSNMPRFALVQFSSSPNKGENLAKALELVEGLPDGVDMAVFPEYMMGYPEGGLTPEFASKLAEPIEGEFIASLREAARRKGVWLLANFFEKGEGKPRNVNVVINRGGDIVAKYAKLHLFDAYGYRESDIFERGDKVVTFDFEGLRVGVATCFDVRFPELFRRMATEGAKAFLLPSAWYAGPAKEEQWFIMGRARAHENVAFMIAVCNSAKPFIGRSYVADPYGIVRVDLGNGEKVGLFDLDEGEVDRAREAIPLLSLRRVDLYG